jgi:hypothetical protein
MQSLVQAAEDRARAADDRANSLEQRIKELEERPLPLAKRLQSATAFVFGVTQPPLSNDPADIAAAVSERSGASARATTVSGTSMGEARLGQSNPGFPGRSSALQYCLVHLALTAALTKKYKKPHSPVHTEVMDMLASKCADQDMARLRVKEEETEALTVIGVVLALKCMLVGTVAKAHPGASTMALAFMQIESQLLKTDLPMPIITLELNMRTCVADQIAAGQPAESAALATPTSAEFKAAYDILIVEPNKRHEERLASSKTTDELAPRAAYRHEDQGARKTPTQAPAKPKARGTGPSSTLADVCRDFNSNKCARDAGDCKFRHVCSAPCCIAKNLRHSYTNCKTRLTPPKDKTE